MQTENVRFHLSNGQIEHLRMQVSEIIFDQKLNLVQSAGRGHERSMQNLPITHCHDAPGTAHFILLQALIGGDDHVIGALEAITGMIDHDPESVTCGCVRWHYENKGVEDTNAAFFTSFPLVCAWLAREDWQTGVVAAAFKDYFSKVSRWFARMAREPEFFYPNKCYADCAMLYSLGCLSDDKELTLEGLDFCHRWFDYLHRRGCGWGEDHSIAYANVLVRMSLLLLAFGCPEDLRVKVVGFLDDIMDFVGFHHGYVPIPAIRGKQSGEVFHEFTPWFDLDSPRLTGKAVAAFVLVPRCGYKPPPPYIEVPRERIHRTFDEGYSVAWIEARARLGTLSRWPLMPNMYHHAEWGVGYQATPAAFIAADCNSGYLQWESVDDLGTRRCHPAEGCADLDRLNCPPLTRPLTFLPGVVQIAHQKQGAAVILRELHRLHAPLRKLSDLWRVPRFEGEVFVDGCHWDKKKPLQCQPEWCVLDYGSVAVAIRPLQCRCKGDFEPQKAVVNIALEGDALVIDTPLYLGPSSVVCEPLLFTGWCVLLLEDRKEIDQWRVEERFYDDGEIPRTYKEYLHTVKLCGPKVSLMLHRDPLDENATRRE